MTGFIKVCGIQTLAEAQGATKAGANTLGFLVGLTHVAEDGIAAEAARDIIAAVPDDIRTVLVTHLLDAHKIAELAALTKVSAIQVHDALPVSDMQVLRGLVPDEIELIKAVHVTGDDAPDIATDYASCCDMVLLDSRTADRLGGTGQTHDWAISRAIVNRLDVPVILAGGLTPDNVEDAIAQVQPAGIDANSGLEDESGAKDFEKISRFAKAGQRCHYIKC